jgi:hypothetical protein
VEIPRYYCTTKKEAAGDEGAMRGDARAYICAQ